MSLSDFLSILISFPTNVFFIPFVVFFIIMLIDMLFDIFDGVLGELDVVDLDNMNGGVFILPPILTKVPLPIALCVSFFWATIFEYYLDTYLLSNFTSTIALVSGVVSLPIIAYLALLVSAFLLKPLAPFFNKENSFATIDYVGLRGKVLSSTVNADTGGEVTVIHNGNEVLLDVFSEGEQEIHYGDEVVIVSQINDSQHYLVAKI
ncbi:DUF1449 domain-containing protein [Vibrio azureus]|uniref:Uncharacterized protein n=1 Tax=Vibrio azureus NBRC 104587 TaxID=1219077 RepID=U3CE28_9VIBR|nr:hypothetical protein [Vibrio azureus]AUI86948.1 DUF1449 domain-containing protein [Vibrio azureus]GAD76578.1 hypothetical protein VAZ01S_046_00480 [Vibrio azureus NBRC 104587]